MGNTDIICTITFWGSTKGWDGYWTIIMVISTLEVFLIRLLIKWKKFFSCSSAKVPWTSLIKVRKSYILLQTIIKNQKILKKNKVSQEWAKIERKLWKKDVKSFFTNWFKHKLKITLLSIDLRKIKTSHWHSFYPMTKTNKQLKNKLLALKKKSTKKKLRRNCEWCFFHVTNQRKE